MNSLETLPWWIKGLIVGVALAILVAVVHWLPPQWAWIALGLAVAAVAFFLLFNPRYRFLRLSSRALQLWLGVRAIGSLSLCLSWGEDRWAIVELAGNPPWSFDVSMAVVVLGFGLLDFFKDGGFTMRINKVGPINNGSGNAANQVGGDGAIQTLNQTITNVQVDPNKTIGDAERQLKDRAIDVTLFILEELKRDHPDLLSPAQRLRVAKALANAYQIRDEYEKAAEQYFAAKEYAENEQDAATFEGFGHWLLSETEKALNLAEAVLGDSPNHEEAWFLAALTDRDPAAANAFLDTVPRQHRKKLNILSALVLRAVSQSDWEAAIAMADQLLQEGPDNIVVKQAAGRGYAAAAFDSWIGRHDFSVDRVNELATKAIGLLTEGVSDKAMGPVSRADLYYHRSLAHRVLGSASNSESDIRTAREHQPHNPKLLFQHCIFLIHEDRLDEALELLNTISGRSLDEGPGLVLARLLFRANEEGSSKNADQAESILLDVLKNNDGLDPRLTYEPLELLCTELAKRGEREKAGKHLEAYREMLDPVGYEAVRAGISFASDEVSEAEKHALRAFTQVDDKTPPVVSIFLSKLLSDLKLDDQAGELLSQIMQSSHAAFVTDLALDVGNRSKNYSLVLNVAERLRQQGRPTIRSAELEVGILESINEFEETISVTERYIEGGESGAFFGDEPDELRRAFVKVLRLRRSLLGFRLGRDELINRNPSDLPGLIDCGKGKPLGLEIACAVAALLSDGSEPKLGHSLAIDIYRENHDVAVAHQCLVRVCGPSSGYTAQTPSEVGSGTAVCFFDNEANKLDWRVIVENDARPSQCEISMDHPLAKALWGKRTGDTFVDDSDPISPHSGTVHELRDATIYRVMTAMQNWRERFGDPTFIRQFRLEGPDGKFDIDKWIKIHEKLNEPLETAKRIYRQDLPSISFFAAVTGRTIIEATGHFAAQPNAILRYGDGSFNEKSQSEIAVRQRNKVVLGPTAIATLFLIRANEKISSLGKGVIVSAGTLEQLRSFYRNPQSRLHSTRIGGVEDGRPFFIEYSDEEIRSNVDQFKAFVDWIESNSTVVGGKAILKIPSRVRDSMCQFFGIEVVESLAIASAESAVLISDDICVTQFPGCDLSPSKANSFYLIQQFAEEELLTETDRVELMHRLISADYRFTPLEQGVIHYAADRAECKSDNINLRCVIEWLHRSGADANDAAAAGAAIVASVWSQTILADRRSLCIREVARSLSQHPAPFAALRRLRTELHDVFRDNESAQDEARRSVDLASRRRSRGELLILPGNPEHHLPPNIAATLRARW